MRKQFFGVALLLSLLLCSVTAFADKPPSFLPDDAFLDTLFELSSDTTQPPSSIETPTDTTQPPASSGTPTDETQPPASSGTPTGETQPPASSGTPTDETQPPASSDTPTDETQPPAGNEAPTDGVFIAVDDISKILKSLQIIGTTLGILVYGLIPLAFAIVCIFFAFRWFCRTFLSGV